MKDSQTQDHACETCGHTEFDSVVRVGSYVVRCRGCGGGPATSYMAIARADRRQVEVCVDPRASEAELRVLAQQLGRTTGPERGEALLIGQHMALRATIAKLAGAGGALVIRWLEDLPGESSSTLDVPCPKCGEAARLSFGECALDTRLVSYQSFHCSHCGRAVEGDDEGPLDGELRARVLSHQGLHGVQLVSGSHIIGMKVVRSLLGLSLAELTAIKAKLPGPILPGTRAEAERVQNALAREGVLGRVVKIDGQRKCP